MPRNMQVATDYSLQELQVAAMAREVADGDVVLAGVGLPCLGGLLAMATHAPNGILVTESGSVGPRPYRILLGIGDNAGGENAIYATSLWRVFSDQQRGFFDLGMVGGAQVDKYGNLNSTVILGEGTYRRPKTRLPGSGGANDIGSSARRTVITMPLQKARFVEKLDYVTTPGHLGGGNDRQQAGLQGGGPVALITDKCVFRFDSVSKEAYLSTLHPGVTIEEVRAEIGWELKVAEELRTTESPTVEQVRITRILDAGGVYTRAGLKDLTFEQYIAMLEESRVAMSELYGSTASHRRGPDHLIAGESPVRIGKRSRHRVHFKNLGSPYYGPL